VGHDALGLDAMGLDIEGPEALELDSMKPDAMESDTGPEVLCRNLLVWALLSAHLVRSDGIWEIF
jgi:hypothetical protein